MAGELAAAYVSLIPSFKGGAKAIADELEPAAESAGTSSGKKAGGGFKGAFSSFFKGAGAAAALFGGLDFVKDAFSQALDRAALPSQLQAQFGLTAPVAAQAAKTASDLYAKGWGESLGDVSTSVADTQRALAALGSNEDTGRITTQAQALAGTFGEEVNPLITAASQLVKTGLAPNMESAFDVITKGFQDGANSGEDFLDTITEYSTQFRKFGLDGTTAIGLINQGLTDGARNSDLVADAIKEFSIRAVDGSKTTAQGFQAIGLNADQMAARIAQGGTTARDAFAQTLDALRNVKDPVAQSQAAVALFGTQAEDLGQALYSLNPATVSATGGMNDVKGAAQQLTDQVGGSTQSSLTALGRTFQQGLGDALTFVVPLLQGLMTVLGPLLPVLGPMAVAIGAITVAQWAWNAALDANPISLIILAVVGLVAGIVALWDKSSAFRDFWITIWDAIKGAAVAVWDWVQKNWPLLLAILTGPIGLAVLAIVRNWDTIKNAVTAVKDWIVARWNDVLGFLRGVPDAIGRFFSGVGETISAPFRAAFNAIRSLWNSTVGGFGFTVPSWIPVVGGKSFTIPYLASGGVITSPTVAMIGEAGPEAVIPLDQLDAMLSGRSGGQTATALGDLMVRVFIGDRELTDIVRTEISVDKRATTRAIQQRVGAAR